jgi:hypothetical protein
VSDQTAKRSIIRHVVFFSSKTPENVERIIEGLSMLGTIPYVRHFEVSRNLHADGFSNEVDIVVYAEFEDEAAMRAYRAHPTYQRSIDVVRPLRELRMAADF